MVIHAFFLIPLFSSKCNATLSTSLGLRTTTKSLLSMLQWHAHLARLMHIAIVVVTLSFEIHKIICKYIVVILSRARAGWTISLSTVQTSRPRGINIFIELRSKVDRI